MAIKSCSSYQPGDLVCRDGFPQKSFCAGMSGCLSCGNISDRSMPHCLRDELPEHFVNDDGSIKFYRRALSAAKEER